MKELAILALLVAWAVASFSGVLEPRTLSVFDVLVVVGFAVLFCRGGPVGPVGPPGAPGATGDAGKDAQ